MEYLFESLPNDLCFQGFGKPKDNFKPLVKEQVLEVAEFVKMNFSRQRTINKTNSSYGIKHIVESNMGKYVSNGTLIAAMFITGFTVQRDGINALFNVNLNGMKHARN